MNTNLLNELYRKYGIHHLEFGAIHDKLGDAYEEFLTIILIDKKNIEYFNKGISNQTLEFQVFRKILQKFGITNRVPIACIRATTDVPHRATGGLSKTDIVATVKFADGHSRELAISSKQSTVAKVAMAEFDVGTICREMGIINPRLRALMQKHQDDCSAQYFTQAEKNELTNLLRPIARDFVRWVITGSKEENPTNIVFPTVMVKYELTKPRDRYNINISNGDFELISFSVYTMEEYIDTIMFNKNGTPKAGGFGTGLSWTYATGSRNTKIQFKG